MKNLNYLQPGLYPGLTFSEYRAYGRFGGSDAAYLATHSPAHWREHRKQPATQDMRFGTAAHVLLLEGRDAFEQQYIISPGFDRRTKAGKSDHLEFVSSHAGREILTPLEYKTLMEMNCAVQESIAGDILESCSDRELSLFWECAVTDTSCCGRLDFVGARTVGDLKTTSDASPDAFLRSVKQYGYHIQAGHYLDGLDTIRYNSNDPIRWLFIAIEKTAPYGVAVYELDDEMLNEGRRLAYIARHKYQEAEEYGYWKGKDAIVKLSKHGEMINLDL